MTAYSDLQSRVVDWLGRSDITSAQIDTFIQLAEARFNRRLIVPERETAATLAATTESVNLPADFWALRAAYVNTQPETTLEQMSLVEYRRAYVGGAAGVPRNYALRGGTMLIGPIPSTSTNIFTVYWATIPALTASNTSNWLIAAHPDIYLSGVLAEAYLLLKNMTEAGVWDSRTEAKIEEVIKTGRRKAAGAAPLAPRGPAAIAGVQA